jgi:hypothetical protein
LFDVIGEELATASRSSEPGWPMQMRGVFFVLGAAGGVGAIVANGKHGDELFPKSSAATICSKARSLLASQATHFACTTRPLEKMSQ